LSLPDNAWSIDNRQRLLILSGDFLFFSFCFVIARRSSSEGRGSGGSLDHLQAGQAKGGFSNRIDH